MKESVEGRSPSWIVSLIPFVFLVAVLVVVIRVFGSDALAGASQVALFTASGVAVAISMVFYRIPWKKFESAIIDNMCSVATSLIILLLIGAVAGSWMISGIVPTMIYYGIEFLSPGIFLAATCVICALISLMTGSSWTTIATVGVALVGVGAALGYSPGWTAGAIISGAYFGDKISPLSDTTVLASSAAGTPLFGHIRYMLVTTVPSIVITVVIFLIMSLCHEPVDAVKAEFAQGLKDTFNISPWLMVVPVLTGVLIAKKVPALITLFLASLMAGGLALVAQPDIVKEVAGVAGAGNTAGLSFAEGFKGLFTAYYGATSVVTGNPDLDSLIATKGMTGMLNTIYLIISAVIFGGVMVGSGMIQSLTDVLIRLIDRRVSLVASTVGTGVFCNMVTGDQYISIILTSSLYKKLYDDMGYENRLLSRSVEDSATIVSVLIPWNSCGMTQATVLKVPTIDYLPYCFFNLISPCMSVFVAATGFRIYRKIKGKNL